MFCMQASRPDRSGGATYIGKQVGTRDIAKDNDVDLYKHPLLFSFGVLESESFKFARCLDLLLSVGGGMNNHLFFDMVDVSLCFDCAILFEGHLERPECKIEW